MLARVKFIRVIIYFQISNKFASMDLWQRIVGITIKRFQRAQKREVAKVLTITI